MADPVVLAVAKDTHEGLEYKTLMLSIPWDDAEYAQITLEDSEGPGCIDLDPDHLEHFGRQCVVVADILRKRQEKQ